MLENDSQPVINRKKIFRGICLALVPTGFSFVLVSNILGQLKAEFILTNAQVGYIGGAALWGMAISLLTIGPFLEKIGLKRASIGAFVCHLAGVTFFLFGSFFAGDPNAFWILFLGAIGFGAGNGLIEVAGNPLTAALFPKNKTTKLNHFHAFFPGSMIFGGLLGFAMVGIGQVGPIDLGHWTTQIAIIYIPILIYGALLIPETFPKTETAEAGIPMREMFRYTFTHPVVWGLIILKMITLSLEMGPGRWIPSVLQSAGVHGILVFVWVSAIMVILRTFAGSFVERFSPTGMLLGSSILTGIGLLMFGFIETGIFPLLLAATIFGAGVAFYFPTMVGLLSERYPKAGSLGIVLMIGFGFFAAGGANAIMGSIADGYLPDALNEEQTVQVMEQVEERYPTYIQEAQDAAGNPQQLAQLGFREVDVQNVYNHTASALSHYRQTNELDGVLTGNALRAITELHLDREEALIAEAGSILLPADNYGGRMSFLWISPIAFVIALIFLAMYIKDKREGGYKVVELTA